KNVALQPYPRASGRRMVVSAADMIGHFSWLRASVHWSANDALSRLPSSSFSSASENLTCDMRKKASACSDRWTPPCSAAGHALRVHVERIDRGACGHEEPIAVDAAEAEVGAALGQVNAPDELGS